MVGSWGRPYTHLVLVWALTSREQEHSCGVQETGVNWGAASVDLDVLWPLPVGPCSPRAIPWAACAFLPASQSRGAGPCPGLPFSTTGGAIWGGCVRGISRHTQGVLGRRLPGTRTPTLSAQLSFASSAATPRTAAFPPQAGNLSSPRGCVSLGPGCEPQLDGRGSLPGCETPRRRHWVVRGG